MSRLDGDWMRGKLGRVQVPETRYTRSGDVNGPRWRERLGEITAPTLVLHGEDDPFFPIGNGEALAAEIPDAHLVRLGRAGHRLPAHTIPVVAEELIAHTAG